MTGYGIGFPKGSRWLPKINSRILNYQKNGERLIIQSRLRVDSAIVVLLLNLDLLALLLHGEGFLKKSGQKFMVLGMRHFFGEKISLGLVVSSRKVRSVNTK